MSGTIICISGAVKAVSSPSGLRSADDAGHAQAKRTTRPRTMEPAPARKPRRSRRLGCSIVGMSSGSPSISVPLSRGSMTRSVRYQPTPTMRTEDRLVKSQLQSGLTRTSGSRIWAADWVKPWSSGSMPEGMKLAEKPPDTPAKAAAMPASGWRPAA